MDLINRVSWRQCARAALAAALLLPLLLALFPSPLSQRPLITSLVKAQSPAFKVLVFSKTAGFRHDAIAVGTQAIQNLAAANNFSVDATEDAGAFTDANLAQYQAVIWLLTTGDVLTQAQQEAFERFIRAGKGYVGVHSASDTEYTWAWYGDLVGAYFKSHPAIQNATVEVADRVHPSTAHLPDYWQRNDEWYDYQTNARVTTHVLATLDEATYTGGTMGADHPIAWCQKYDGGRSWYTGMGHTQASYGETNFQQHLLGGIQWAAGVKPGNCEASDPTSFQKVVLDQNVNDSLVEPLALDVLPDGRVIYVTRRGVVKLWKPASNGSLVAATVRVSTQFEDGLTGVVADPGFASNKWVYLFYSAPDVTASRVSRFTLDGDTLDLASEKIVLQFTVVRGGGHTGGGLAFDDQGNLFISTGDNNGATGYAQIGAEVTSGNTNDLRGKVLRITPQADGSYTIPAGNLFAPGTDKTRPEIYAMGFRNPYRISYDAESGRLYVGDVGPDAGSDSATQGPRGYDEINVVESAGNYGWPYCIANNLPYPTYPNNTCANNTNNHAGNTGLTTLPPARGAWIYYHGGTTPYFPELGTGGRTALAGPVYHYDDANPLSRKLPSYYDDTLLIYEFSRNWMKEVRLDDNGGLLKINPFASGVTLNAPIDMKIGPDGAIYLLEYAGWFNGSNSTRLSRVDYVGGQTGQAPVVEAATTPDSGQAPLLVQFSADGSYDPDGGPLTYGWDFESDGIVDSTAAAPTHTYALTGTVTARLTVTDTQLLSSTLSLPVTVGNTRPEIEILGPPDGSFMEWGGTITYTVSVSDAEDGSTAASTVDCSQVTLQPAVGHDTHAHPLAIQTGCSGTIDIPISEHDDTENVYLIVSASYADDGAPGLPTLSAHDTITLHPKRKQAEHFTSQGGVLTQLASDMTGGGMEVVGVDPNDWIAFAPINLEGITSATLRVASAPGGTIELRSGSTSGPLVGSVTLPAATSYREVDLALTDPLGTSTLFLVFKGSGANLFKLNWLQLNGAGVSSPGPTPTASPTVVPGTCTDSNVALGAQATASSVENNTLGAGNAVDGSTGSRWASAHNLDPSWLQIDLGTLEYICRVRLNWEAAYASAYELQASYDGTTWTTFYGTATGDGNIDDLAGLTIWARYIRVYGTRRALPYGYSLYEVELFAGYPIGTATPTATPGGPTNTSTPTMIRTPTPDLSACSATNVARGKTATASSVENAGTGAPMAVDGNTGTRWASAFSDPQWIQIDLGASMEICAIKLNWEAAFGKNYELQVADDPAGAWMTIKAVVGGDGGIDLYGGLSTTARYIRMYGTVRGLPYGYSLYEFEVYPKQGTVIATNTTTPTRTITQTRTPTGVTPTNSRTPTATVPAPVLDHDRYLPVVVNGQ